jgi:phage terminase small subunit
MPAVAEFDASKPLGNAKHERFAQNMALGKMTGRDAYLDAGYSGNTQTADSGASKLVRNPKVAARIEHLKTKLEQKVIAKAAVSAERVLEEMAKIGFANIADLVEWRSDLTQVKDNEEGGAVEVVKHLYSTRVNFLDSDKVPHDLKAAVKSVRLGKDGSLTLEMHSKTTALQQMGDHLGMFAKKLAITPNGAGGVDVEELSPMEAARRIAFAFDAAKRERAKADESA